MKKVTFIQISSSKKTDKKFAMVQVEDTDGLTVGGIVCITRASLNEAGIEYFKGLKKGDEVNLSVRFSGEQLEGTSIEKVHISANA